jgi:hypothetical protein
MEVPELQELFSSCGKNGAVTQRNAFDPPHMQGADTHRKNFIASDMPYLPGFFVR